MKIFFRTCPKSLPALAVNSRFPVLRSSLMLNTLRCGTQKSAISHSVQRDLGQVLGKIVFLLFVFSSAYALSPETRLTDEAQEQRAMKLFLQVRCLVCGGQVIENSNTEFSFEMRKLIRQEISAGKSDEEIKAQLVKKFGEDILVSPNFKSSNGFLLWCLPLIFAAITIIILRKNLS